MSYVELFAFQREDVDKLARQQSALIGSEMGVGKTHQAIALDEIWYKQRAAEMERQGIKNPVEPTLVVAPLNTHDSWVEKYKMQTPSTEVYVIDRKDRPAFIKAIHKRRADVYLMHWEALRYLPELRTIKFNTIIADEVHRAANRKSQATRALKELKTNHKLGLSGTATGDAPQNLWSILNWLWPKYYKSFWKFFNKYVVTEATNQGYSKIVGVRDTLQLRQQIDPFYVRHLKRDRCCVQHPQGVMYWLPEKVYDQIWVDLTPTQRRVYEQMRHDMVAWVGEHEESPLVASAVVAQMARLSQIALATPTVSVGRDGEQIVNLELPSAKIEKVIELVSDHKEKQFVVFSASRKACYLMQEALTKLSIKSEVLSGATPQSQRDGMVRRFANGDFKVFIGVIQAAGEGIDGLQAATDTIIFLDRTWSSWRNKQAEDRLHREGQKDTVQIIDVMARNTIDLGRYQKLEAKWEWVKKILGDDFNNTTIEEEEDLAA